MGNRRYAWRHLVEHFFLSGDACSQYEAVCCNVIPLLMGHPPLLATRVVHFPQFLSSSLSLSFTS